MSNDIQILDATGCLKQGSVGLHKRLHKMGVLLNVVIGTIVFGGFMIVEGVLSWPVLVAALVFMIGGAPIVGFIMPKIHKRFEPELHKLLDKGPEKLSPE